MQNFLLGLASAVLAGIVLHLIRPYLPKLRRGSESHPLSPEDDAGNIRQDSPQSTAPAELLQEGKQPFPFELIILVPILFILIVFLMISIAGKSGIMAIAAIFWIIVIGMMALWFMLGGK